MQHVTQASAKFFTSLLQSCDQPYPLQTSAQLSPRFTQQTDPIELLQQDVKAAAATTPTGKEMSGMSFGKPHYYKHFL